jgi:hypothetical protein
MNRIESDLYAPCASRQRKLRLVLRVTDGEHAGCNLDRHIACTGEPVEMPDQISTTTLAGTTKPSRLTLLREQAVALKVQRRPSMSCSTRSPRLAFDSSPRPRARRRPMLNPRHSLNSRGHRRKRG